VTVADSLHSGFGKVRVPLAATGEQDLASIDPARDILLDLFAAALIAEVTPRWESARRGTPLAGKAVVEQKFPEFPEQIFLQQTGTAWPMLAVYRSDDAETFDEFTLWQERVTCKWGVDYCIGPLEFGNFVKLNAILTLVPRIIERVIREGGHRAYATQQVGNAVQTKQVFGTFDGCCGFSTIRVVQSQTGSAAFAQGGPKFHCASVVLETTELSTQSDGLAPPYLGTSITIESGDGSGLLPLVVADTAIPKT
jgi:hypothetical protein